MRAGAARVGDDETVLIGPERDPPPVRRPRRLASRAGDRARAASVDAYDVDRVRDVRELAPSRRPREVRPDRLAHPLEAGEDPRTRAVGTGDDDPDQGGVVEAAVRDPRPVRRPDRVVGVLRGVRQAQHPLAVDAHLVDPGVDAARIDHAREKEPAAVRRPPGRVIVDPAARGGERRPLAVPRPGHRDARASGEGEEDDQAATHPRAKRYAPRANNEAVDAVIPTLRPAVLRRDQRPVAIIPAPELCARVTTSRAGARAAI